MCLGDPMNLFPVIFLAEGHRPQDRSKNHPRAMNPCQGLVQADGPAGLGSWHSRRAKLIEGGHEVQIRRDRAQSAMYIAAGCGAMPSRGEAGSGDRGDQRSECYQTEPLMHLEHVRSFVESCLILSVSL